MLKGDYDRSPKKGEYDGPDKTTGPIPTMIPIQRSASFSTIDTNTFNYSDITEVPSSISNDNPVIIYPVAIPRVEFCRAAIKWCSIVLLIITGLGFIFLMNPLLLIVHLENYLNLLLVIFQPDAMYYYMCFIMNIIIVVVSVSVVIFGGYANFATFMTVVSLVILQSIVVLLLRNILEFKKYNRHNLVESLRSLKNTLQERITHQSPHNQKDIVISQDEFSVSTSGNEDKEETTRDGSVGNTTTVSTPVITVGDDNNGNRTDSDEVY